MAKVWRIFALLNGIGVLLLTFGTVCGDPIRQAFTPVGLFLLLPGIAASVAIGPHLGNTGAQEVVLFLVTVAINFVAWYTILRVMRG